MVGGWGISTSDFEADKKCMELFGEDQSWQYGPEAGSSGLLGGGNLKYLLAVLVAL